MNPSNGIEVQKGDFVMKKVGLLACALASSVAFGSNEVEKVPGELIVKFKDGLVTKNLEAFGMKIDKEVKLSYGLLHVVSFDQKSQSAESLIQKLNNQPNVEYAEPNFIYRVVRPVKETSIEDILSPYLSSSSSTYTPSDPRYSNLWGLNNTGRNEPGGSRSGIEGADISAEAAWEMTKGSDAVKIAVIDTGVDYEHPDLAQNMWINQAELNGEEGVDDDGNSYVDDIYGYDFANDDADPMDGHSHGTHCAGTIGAVHNNDEGVAGVMANVKIVAVKFLTDSGSGSTADAIRAIDYATTVGVDLMSNSWGGGGRSQALEDAIQRASDAGIIFTAASGNSSSNNDSTPHFPSNYEVDNVISVAAHNAQEELASFSSYGRSTVHIAAPGRNILSTTKNGGYSSYSGTSMATPHISGALGLLLAQEGRMSHADMKERLMATSIPVGTLRGKTINGGRLDAYNLLTDTRPERNAPTPGEWESIALDEIWESQHPYADESNLERVFQIEGAKFMRLKIRKYDVEKNYDFIKVSNANRQEVEKISGAGEDYLSDYVEGDTLRALFTSDGSVNRWGVVVEEIQVQYE